MANSSPCGARAPCEDCGSSDSVQVFINEDVDLGIEWFSSFCFGKCYSQKGDPYMGKTAPKVIVKTEAELKEEVDTITSCKPFTVSEPYRGIPPKFYKGWGCRTLLSEFDGKTPYAIAFPYSDYGQLSGWKARPFRKKTFWTLGKTKNVDVFGLIRALRIGGDTLWVTEGEFDTIALNYCLTLAGPLTKYPVVSLTMGGGSIEQNIKYIETRVRHKFKYKCFVLDKDDVGIKAEETVKNLWPESIIIGKPGKAKDANNAVELNLAQEMGELALNFKKITCKTDQKK